MAVASVRTPIAPPSASISRTIWPLATPPIAGLQLIWPTVSQFIVKQRGPQPHPRRGQRGLEPGMAGAHHDHIEIIGRARHRGCGTFRGSARIGGRCSPCRDSSSSRSKLGEDFTMNFSAAVVSPVAPSHPPLSTATLISSSSFPRMIPFRSHEVRQPWLRREKVK